MSKMQELLPVKIQQSLDDWFEGSSYEIIHFWRRESTFCIVVVTTDNHVVCLRIWESLFSENVGLSVDKDFDLEEGQ